MKLIRLFNPTNLLLILAAQLVFRYGFMEQMAGLPQALNYWQYGLFILATLLIAAGGALVYNIEITGKAEKAGITEATGYNIYLGVTIVGLAIGYYIADLIGKPGFVAIFVVAGAIGYIHATSLRNMIAVGNFLVALTAALVILAPGIFNLYPFLSVNPDGAEYLQMIFWIHIEFAFFVFLIVLLCTFVSDLKNTDLHYNAGVSSLPIALGKDRTIKILFFFSLVPAGLLLYYGGENIIDLTYALGYGLLFILGPLVYFMIKLWSAKTNKDFAHLEGVLKLILFFTPIAIAVITYNIHINAAG